MQAIWSKLALPLVQVTSCGQVFKIHFLHWFIYQLSLYFTTWNKTVTWKLHVCTISKGLPKWTWQSRCYNFWWEIFHCAIVIPMVQRVLVIIKCTCAAAHTLLLCSFWSLNWCELQPLLINSMGRPVTRGVHRVHSHPPPPQRTQRSWFWYSISKFRSAVC